MQTDIEKFQLSAAAAEMYESTFVPALFAEWAPLLVDVARVAPGQAVLDVACGTGIVARVAADAQRGDGRVAGVDLNPAMLGVARRVRPEIDWREGDAASLPFPDDSFDVVLCQMALMFFPDRVRALREMARVVTKRGTVGLVVPAALPAQPAYAPFVEMVARHAGPDARALLGAYFACGDPDELGRWIEAAGLRVAARRTHRGHVKCLSIDAFVATEVESTPLRERMSDDVYARIRDDARAVLRPFVVPGGAAEIPLEGHLVTAARG